MYIFSGFFVGILVGLTGVGGGSLMTPILLLIFGVAPASAVGTDLWFAALTKLVAGGIHHKKSLIDWQVVKRLWMGSIPASALMLYLMQGQYIQIDRQLLTLGVASMVIVTAIGMVFQLQLQGFGKQLRISHQDAFKAWQPLLTVLAGILLGALVTLTSIGAGAIGVVLLTYLYPLRLTPVKLVATDIIHAIPLAIFAGIGHLLMGHVDFALLGLLLLGSVPGVLIGTKLSSTLPPKYVRIALAAVLLVVGVKLMIGAH